MLELKTARKVESDEWLRVSSKVAQIAVLSGGAKAAFVEAASALQSLGPLAVSMVVALNDREADGYVFGFSEAFGKRAASLYEKGHRLEEPVKGSSGSKTEYVLWPELAREGISRFVAWPLRTAGRSLGVLTIGVSAENETVLLPPDEFIETFAGALALVIDRNSLLSSSESRREERTWHQKLLDSMVQGTTDAICVTDSVGRVFLLNPAAEAMLGIREGEVLGRRFCDVDGRFRLVSHLPDGAGPAVFHAILRPASEDGEDNESVEAFRVSIFEHGGREYSSWVLRRASSVSGASADVVAKTSIPYEGAFSERLAVFSCDKDGRILSQSTSLASLVGVSPAELDLGVSILDIRVFKTAKIAETIFKCIISKKPEVSQHELSHRTRGVVHFTLHCTPIVQSNAQFIGVQAVLEDTTDIVRTRTSLTRSEERYRVFFNNAPVTLVELDLSPSLPAPSNHNLESAKAEPSNQRPLVVAVNPAAVMMYAADSASKLRERWVSLNEETATRLIEQQNLLRESNESLSFQSCAKTVSGDTIEVSVRAAVAPGYEQDLSKVTVSVVDITQITSMERTLRGQLAMERLVSRVSGRFVGMAPEKTSEGIEDAMEEIGSVLGLDVAALFEPVDDEILSARRIWTRPDRPLPEVNLSSFRRTDFPLFSKVMNEFKVVRMDSPTDLPEESAERNLIDRLGICALLIIPMAAQGEIRGALALASREEKPWGDENIALFRIIADVAADALDRERRDTHRRESEDLLSTVFQSMVGGLIVTSPESVVLLANPSAASSFKAASPDELIGRPIGDIVKGGAELLRPSAPGEQQQIVLTLKDGTRCTFGFTTALGASGRCIVLFRDLSRMIESVRRQKRAEELARLGLMTAKLSHEIKNPLSSILLGLAGLEESKALAEDDLFVLRSVLKEVRYLKSYLGSLLDGMRFHDIAPVLQSVRPVVYGALETQSRIAERSGVRLKMIDNPQSITAIIDKPAMIRALGNLVKNAVEACAPNDEVKIGVRLLLRDETKERFPGFKGEVLCLFVEDTGPGIPAEVMENLFVPFTTTKTSGTGLGLSMVQETVAGHGGVIEVTTPIDPNGGGTRFEILLPFGVRPACLDIHKDEKGCEACPVPEGCPVREAEGYYSCWTVKGKASMAETGKWNAECVVCPVYLAGNLEHYHSRSAFGRHAK